MTKFRDSFRTSEQFRDRSSLVDAAAPLPAAAAVVVVVEVAQVDHRGILVGDLHEGRQREGPVGVVPALVCVVEVDELEKAASLYKVLL